jgi:hypothetical protein
MKTHNPVENMSSDLHTSTTDKPSTQSLFAGGKPGETKTATGTPATEGASGKGEGEGKSETGSPAPKSEATAPAVKVAEARGYHSRPGARRQVCGEECR